MTALRLNPDGLVAFGLEYFGEDTMRGAILTHDGTSFARIALATDIAPDSGGSMFGRYVSLVGLNGAGDVAFTAPLVLVGAPRLTPSRTTIYIAPAGGSPVRIAGPPDAAPGTGGGTMSQISTYGFNNRGEVLFREAIDGGSGGFGIFAGSTAGVRKIDAHGDPNPAGGFHALMVHNMATGITRTVAMPGDPSPLPGGAPFTSLGNNVYLNANGDVRAIALNGTASPAGGSCAFVEASMDVRVNTAGDILFQAPLAGASADSGLFLRRASTGITESVAVQGQFAAGASHPLWTIEGTINSFPGEDFALGPKGEVLFNAPVDVEGRLIYGIFKYRGPGTLEKLILRGEPVPDSGGGTAGVMTQGRCIGAPGLSPGLFFLAMMVVDGSFGHVIYATDMAPPTVSAATSQPELWPPSGRLWPVTISGSAADDGGGLGGRSVLTR